MKVDFYHLTVQPIDKVLPTIAEKVLAAGDRLLIVVRDDAQAAAIDRLLWTYRADSFLPHGCAGAGDDAAQPVLIATDVAASGNGATNIAIVDGVWRDEALGFARSFHFFDEEAIGAAREAWRGLADRDGVERRYWKQDEDGRWRQAA